MVASRSSSASEWSSIVRPSTIPPTQSEASASARCLVGLASEATPCSKISTIVLTAASCASLTDRSLFGGVVGQADQRTTRLGRFEVRPGQIGADDPGCVIARLSGAIGDRLVFAKKGDRLGIKLSLALKIVVEAASREPRTRHDLVDRHGRKAVPIEQLSRTLDDSLTDVRALTE